MVDLNPCSVPKPHAIIVADLEIFRGGFGFRKFSITVIPYYPARVN